MRKPGLAAVVLLAFTSNAFPDTASPMAAIQQYIDAFNRTDVTTMAATCAPDATILDGLAPHSWPGPNACADWYRDVEIAGQHEGASDYFIKLADPAHLDVKGDSAYAVFPATMTFKVHGKQITQTGSTWTVALRKLPEGWRIAAWAWAKGKAL